MIFFLTKMVNKCAAFGCSSGYSTNRESVSTFSFPLGKSNLLEKWVNLLNIMTGFIQKIQFFVSNILMKNLFWKESETNWTGIYIQFLKFIQKKIRKLSLLLTTTELRKPQKCQQIIHQPDELQDFLTADTIKDFNHLEEEKCCLNGFEF